MVIKKVSMLAVAVGLLLSGASGIAGTASAAVPAVSGGGCANPSYQGSGITQKACVSVHSGTSNPAYGDGYVATKTANCFAQAVLVVNGTQKAAGARVNCTTSNGAYVHIPAAAYTCAAGNHVETELIVNVTRVTSITYSPMMYF